MPSALTYPGVYVEEIPSGVRTITGVATSVAAFVGAAKRGPVDVAVIVNSFGDYERIFGGLSIDSTMSYAVRDFYLNGGSQAIIVRLSNGTPATIGLPGGAILTAASPGVWGERLRVRSTNHPTDASLYNLVVRDPATGTEERFINVSIDPNSARRADKVLTQSSSLVRFAGGAPVARPTPPHPDVASGDPFADNAPAGSYAQANTDGDEGAALADADYLGDPNLKTGIYALRNTDIFNLLCIPPMSRAADVGTPVQSAALALCVERRAMLIVDPPSGWTSVANAVTGIGGFALSGQDARNAAIFFPRLSQPDLLQDGLVENFVPCGAVAGVFARTDTQRGVWKAPAGLDASLNGVPALQISLTDAENGQLNPLGVNCLRSFGVAGRVIWGSRTLRGADQLADEWKYIPVRRTALYIEESLFRGTKWVVFEPNDEPLWAQIRLNVGAFMHNLFRQGAFQGTTPREAYFVKCDRETTTQNDINLGIVNIVVGFAPLKPAEFVVIKLQQIAGQIEV
jgi:Bacteriophage tail sheath protein